MPSMHSGLIRKRLIKRCDHIQGLLKDYELKIENIRLVVENTIHDFPGR